MMVLEPIEFCIYTTALGAILRHHNIDYQIYADDTQLYCSFDTNSPLIAIDQIQSYIADIRFGMIKIKLKIDDQKTEFLIITSKRSKFSADIRLYIGEESIPPSLACKSLGVMIDQHCDMETQIRHTCRTAYFHPRNMVIYCQKT